jgi:hypothetical protein
MSTPLTHLPTPGGKWLCGCPFEKHATAYEADACRLQEFRYPDRWEYCLTVFSCFMTEQDQVPMPTPLGPGWMVRDTNGWTVGTMADRIQSTMVILWQRKVPT